MDEIRNPKIVVIRKTDGTHTVTIDGIDLTLCTSAVQIGIDASREDYLRHDHVTLTLYSDDVQYLCES